MEFARLNQGSEFLILSSELLSRAQELQCAASLSLLFQQGSYKSESSGEASSLKTNLDSMFRPKIAARVRHNCVTSPRSE